jgi:nicotinate-nucleotide adenylyltransferase
VDVVTFVPAGDPWQKSDDRQVTPASIRCEMLEAATAGTDHFEVDRREVDRDGPTYTWDTIESFTDDEVILILGADAAAGMSSWHRGSELIEKVSIAVARRPGTVDAAVSEVLDDVYWLRMPSLDISSTELREWRRSGFSARFLIPDPVRAVIDRHVLYSDANLNRL